LKILNYNSFFVNKKTLIMENKKMTLALFSGSLDKLTAAGVILSGAAADDMDIDLFVLLQGARAFKKEVGDRNDKLEMAECPAMKEEFIASLKKLNVKSWIEFFKEAKELTNVKIHICGLAGKIWGGEKLEDFVDIADDICGIGEYISSAQEADVHLFI
jgi:peroxiredoxin family protein